MLRAVSRVWLSYVRVGACYGGRMSRMSRAQSPRRFRRITSSTTWQAWPLQHLRKHRSMGAVRQRAIFGLLAATILPGLVVMTPSAASADTAPAQISSDAAPDVLAADESTLTHRYMTGTVTSERQLKQLQSECESSTCFLLPIEEGLSPLDQFVLLAESDSSVIPEVLDFLTQLAHDPTPLHRKMEGESLETFVADIEDAVASVLAEQVVPGSGRARRGIGHSTDSDPLSDFASGEGLPPGNTLGTHGSWQSYFDGDYVWRGIKTRDFGYFSLAGWDVVAKLQFEYRMSLNGRQVRFWQKITVPQIWGEFKLGYNDSRCRIDRFGPDRDCDNHPNPSNGLGEWTRSLRQPEGGYDYVYDSS